MSKDDSRALSIGAIVFTIWFLLSLVVDAFAYSDWYELVVLAAGIVALLAIYPAVVLSFMIWPKDPDS